MNLYVIDYSLCMCAAVKDYISTGDLGEACIRQSEVAVACAVDYAVLLVGRYGL